MRGAIAFAFWLIAAAAYAQAPTAAPLPSAVAEDSISVGSDYRGSSITVFGFNPDRRGRGDIVVVVRGPDEPAVVMRKRRVFGLWVNGNPVRFSEAPTFFATMSTRRLDQIVPPNLIRQYQLDPAASARLGSTVRYGDPAAYRAALVRLRRAQRLYQEHVGVTNPTRQAAITRYPGGLFRAVVRLPANAPIDRYRVDTYLFRDRRLVSSARLEVNINRVGLEQQIHELATQASAFYGIVIVLMALTVGWGASVLFRRN